MPEVALSHEARDGISPLMTAKKFIGCNRLTSTAGSVYSGHVLDEDGE